jgi:hypothetical protein
MNNRSLIYTYLFAMVALYTVALSSGCAHSPRSTPAHEPANIAVPRERLTGFTCQPGRPDTESQKAAQREARFTALKLDLPVDHVRFVRHGSRTDQETFAAHGAPCAAARDHAACEAKLTELEARGRVKKQVFAITTHLDELKLYEGREVIALLAPIDNPAKAWTALMVHNNVSSYACNDPDWDAYRESHDGYDLAWVWTARTCRPFERHQAIDHIDRTGNLTRLRTHVVEHNPEACLRDSAESE